MNGRGSEGLQYSQLRDLLRLKNGSSEVIELRGTIRLLDVRVRKTILPPPEFEDRRESPRRALDDDALVLLMPILLSDCVFAGREANLPAARIAAASF
jgi:hypothetical protein